MYESNQPGLTTTLRTLINMAKRFTDANKWRNEWFRTLSMKAKLLWVYLCDECESHGIIKLDYGLASFQLGFTITKDDIVNWLGKKIFFISDEKIIILQFFEFQYGQSKDSWSAKIRAKEQLESLGFDIENNKITIPEEMIDEEMNPQWGHGGTTCLIRGRGRVIGRVRVNNKEEEKNFLIESWNEHSGPLAKVQKITGPRLKKINQHIKDLSEDQWIQVIKKIAASDFCCGKNDRGWVASFDWLLGKDKNGNLNYVKALEGNYDNRESHNKTKLDVQNDKFAETLSAIKEGKL